MNNDPHISAHNAAVVSQDEIMSALFAQMVMQQSSLAMMLLGKTPHPESGETIRDIEGARLFIDQLEMIELKTKGNLSKEEAALLKQSLMALRMAFVEAVDDSPPKPENPPLHAAPPAAAVPSGGPNPAGSTPSAPSIEEDHRTKFSKKY